MTAPDTPAGSRRVVHIPRSDTDDLFRMLALAEAAEATGVQLVTVDDGAFMAAPTSSEKYRAWLDEAKAMIRR